MSAAAAVCTTLDHIYPSTAYGTPCHCGRKRWDGKPDQGEPLQAGWIVEVDGEPHRVEYVNYSRAYCVPVNKKEVVLKDDSGNEKARFGRTGRGVNIAPGAMVKIISKETDMAKGKEKCKGIPAGTCEEILDRENKSGLCRACKKREKAVQAEVAAGARQGADLNADGTADELRSEMGEEERRQIKQAAKGLKSETETTGKGVDARETTVAKKNASKKAAAPKKAAKAKATNGAATERAAHTYATTAKEPGEMKGQRGAVYAAVKALGADKATAAAVLKRIEGKVETKGDLKKNTAFYLSALKRDGFLKISKSAS